MTGPELPRALDAATAGAVRAAYGDVAVWFDLCELHPAGPRG